jgi:hypothetical protein
LKLIVDVCGKGSFVLLLFEVGVLVELVEGIVLDFLIAAMVECFWQVRDHILLQIVQALHRCIHVTRWILIPLPDGLLFNPSQNHLLHQLIPALGMRV